MLAESFISLYIENMNYTSLKEQLFQDYSKKYPRSEILNIRGRKVLVDGGSHAIRLLDPFPPRIRSAKGAYIVSEEGESILDFWQGHHANILGHNPEAVCSPLSRAFSERFGLQTGFTDNLQIETAEILCKAVGAEKVRFTTSGSLATMYSIVLARAFTGRDLVMKIGGGWHGAQPWGLKGVDFHYDSDRFQHLDSEGLPPEIDKELIVTPYNNCQALEENMKKYGDSIACFIMEPFIGAGGFFPADREFIETAYSLTRKYGVLLIFDEVISGFRFCPGNASSLYGVQPDLATFGKIIGGGMPVSAVAGKGDIMDLSGSGGKNRVKFSGGTYSAHPASLLAAKIQMQYLIDHQEEVYPHIGNLGEKVRISAEKIFQEEGVYACCTGYGNDAVKQSSLSMLFFPHKEGYRITKPSETRDPSVLDIELGSQILQICLLLQNVHIFHGIGSVSFAHTDEDINFFQEALRAVARIFRSHR